MINRLTRTRIDALDVRIAIAVAICCLSATILNQFGISFTYGEKHLEILQKMTACITCLLCCQEDTKVSLKAGINRLVITAIGGIVGILVIAVDIWFNNGWLFVPLVALGILATLYFCKAAGVPYINARIGGVTFILVTCTLTAETRILYALFRFASTFYGVVVVLVVTWLFNRKTKKNC